MKRTKKPTKAQMERVLLRYGRRILEGDAREAAGQPRGNAFTVTGYCRALKAVWDMAKAMAKEATK